MKTALLCLLACASLLAAEPRKTKNIILLTADGLRWQEIFTGIDATLMKQKDAGMEGAQAQRDRLWKPTGEERRELLLPFFWKELAPRGVVLGNVTKGSSVRVTNQYRVSYPGYSEILTGRSRDDVIRGNDKQRNPTQTVLEFLKSELGLDRSQVALFGSWDLFSDIGEHTPGSITINAGYDRFEGPRATSRLLALSALQFDIRTPWDSVRHDYITMQMALEYMKTSKPRVMHIALGETDDWAHDRRYDRVLDTIAFTDRCLRELWTAIESIPEYRGTTSVLLTSDHGRGGTPENWHGHGHDYEGADQIWIAIAGPDTPPQGEAAPATAYFQRDVAPTALDLLGIDYRKYKDVAGKPIPLARARP